LSSRTDQNVVNCSLALNLKNEDPIFSELSEQLPLGKILRSLAVSFIYWDKPSV